MTKYMWNKLAQRFNLHKLLSKVHPDAAVNIFLGWPTFLNLINEQRHLLKSKSCKILDYGSGTGAMCNKLNELGHSVIGIDISPSMIKLATKNTSSNIRYMEADLSENTIKSNKLIRQFDKSFDAILSMHSTEWIENIDTLLNNLTKLLSSNGLILFAIFPEKHIIESLAIKDLFEDFDSKLKPRKGFANFDGVKVPVFVRSVKYFDDWFTKRNFEKVIEYYPEITPIFKKKYNWKGANYPEMVIIGYRNYDFKNYLKSL